MNRKILSLIVLFITLNACQSSKKSNAPVIGFVDAFEDATIKQAKTGFIDALSKNGFDEKKQTIQIKYRNAQGDIPTLTQIVDYFITEKVDLIATNVTLSTVTAARKTSTIPIFMMVSSSPTMMKLNQSYSTAPDNLKGIYENLAYIDTSFSIIPQLIKPKSSKLVVGMIYNQSEPQSVIALDRISGLCKKLNIKLESLPVNTSAEAQLVVQSLLSKNIDAFFANPDNTVFASFETILKSCNNKHVPVFTSEAGLVKRGAVAAFGADLYLWGYQAGEQAAAYLKNKDLSKLQPELVKVRNRVYNPAAAQAFKIEIPSTFKAVK
ncbi:MAG: transporter substrate binding protein [Sphingobacteriales bacterium]|nr:transporter substrate binding protein [Sphingobacteriales bacterium]